MRLQPQVSFESAEAARLPPSHRLLTRPWLPGADGAGSDLQLSRDPLAPPQLLVIDRGDSAVAAALPGLGGLLAPPERARLRRLRRAGDRDRFLLGRAVLRLCLAALLNRPPASLVLAIGPHGKPCLAHADGLHPREAPRFNVAHSGRLVLLGFHGAREVGVDVERKRPELDWRPIARRCLSVDELSRLEALPAAAQGMAFLQAWCELEAVQKARGVGLGRRERPEQGLHPLEVATEESMRIWSVALPADYAGAAALA